MKFIALLTIWLMMLSTWLIVLEIRDVQRRHMQQLEHIKQILNIYEGE